jgi:cytochrome P450
VFPSEWGQTLLTANKEDWRRHRRIIGPAFNPSTYSLVWAETSQIYKEIITTEGWTQKDVVTLDPVQAYTTRVAFLVISACGFGLRFRWEGETETGDGDMGIQKAMRIWADSLVLRAIAPSWMYKLPFKRSVLQLHDPLICFLRRLHFQVARHSHIKSGSTGSHR